MNKHPHEMFLQINITSRCNIACTHCYVDDAPMDMDTALFSEAIRQFDVLKTQLGVDRAWVQISGGEPLVHPHFFDILKTSAELFPTKILTNGILIDQTTAQFISQHCESVQISFDGDREIHESRRGKGSFDAAMDGLIALKKTRVPVSARITVGDDNFSCVESLFRCLEDHIDAFHVSRVVPMGDCDVRLPNTHVYRKIIYWLYATHVANTKIGLRDPFFGPLMSIHAGNCNYCGCSAGISGLCITQTGDIYPCRRLPIVLGNISEVSLSDVYFEHSLLKQLRARELGGRCGGCEYKLCCGGSRCIAYALTGDPLAADPGCIFADFAGNEEHHSEPFQ